MATYYISAAGDDTTGDGSEGDPWLTISKAVASSTGGDTIRVLAGTLTFAAQLFASARTIIGDGASTTIMDGAGAAVAWTMAANVAISGLTFTNATSNGAAGHMWNTASGVVCSLTNCVLDSLGTGFPTALFGSSDASPGTLSVVGCLIIHTSYDPGGSGVLIYSSGGPMIMQMYNNTIYSDIADTNTPQFWFGNAANRMTFDLRNNIIWNDNGSSHIFTSGTAATYDGDSASNLIRGYDGSVPSLTDTLTDDPLFVDVGAGNFNLRPTSPAIGNGVIV